MLESDWGLAASEGDAGMLSVELLEIEVGGRGILVIGVLVLLPKNELPRGLDSAVVVESSL